MKKLSLIFTLLFVLLSHAWAQTSEESITVIPLTTETILPGTYRIAGERIFKVNDQTFSEFTIERHDPINQIKPINLQLNCIADENRKINLDRALLVTNIAGTLAAGYGVFAVNPKQDKVRHFLAGYEIANGTSGAFQLFLPSDMKHRKLVSAMAGFGASVLVGVGKEVRDAQGYGTPSTKDALATAAGGLGGTLTISIVDVQNAFKKKKRPIIEP